MLDDAQLEILFNGLGLSAEARVVARAIRSSPPSRRVQNRRGNVNVRYPSRKMGMTIQAESHTVEFPLILEMEWDPRVHEFYDQPAPIKLLYPRKDGRQLGVLHTPDFFVIRDDGLGWVECKSEQELSKLAAKMPNRYEQADSFWCCPPGERYASQFGFSYRVKSSAEFNETYLRNLVFLEEYLRKDLVPEGGAEELIGRVMAEPGITLAELLRAADGNGADRIYAAIALGDLYVDVHQVLLAEPEKVPVFANLSAARTLGSAVIQAPPRIGGPSVVSLVPGSPINWDGRQWTIVNVGAQSISLVSKAQEFVELPVPRFEALVSDGKITGDAAEGLRQRPSQLQEYLTRASPEDLQHANHRYQAIEPLLTGTRRAVDSSRTERYWVKKFRDSAEVCGSGFVGLLSHRWNKGNRRRKLPEETLALMDEFIDKHYENPKQMRILAVWGLLLKECESRAILPPSYKTFTKAVHQRAGLAQTNKRKGRRAAYQQAPFIWHLGFNTPHHGDRPWEIVHVDHTELDVELVCSRTGQNLGRPWLTLLIDAFSRRILAFHLAFDSPSYRSVLMILRECVKRHSRLPQIIVVDNGTEFYSTYFETFLARYEIVKKQRPPAQARFGSVCERLFGTANTRFIHTLSGNTQIMKNVRQVTKSINPKSLACWTFAELNERLSQWVYEIYDTVDHPSLGQTPRDAYRSGMEKGGPRAHRLIPYDEDFKIFTLPTTPKGMATVVPGHGIKIHYLFYWSDVFRDPQVEKTRVRVRYDPFDAGVAYAYVKNRWVRCVSQNFRYFQGRSEKEIQIATAELSKNSTRSGQQLKITARRLADFLSSSEDREVLLRQRLKDAQTKETLNLAPQPSLAANRLVSPELTDRGDDNPAADSTVTGDEGMALEDYEEF